MVTPCTGMQLGQSKHNALKLWQKRRAKSTTSNSHDKVSAKIHYMGASRYMLVGDGPDQPDVVLVHIVEGVSELLIQENVFTNE